MKLTKKWLKAHSACMGGYEYAINNLIGLTEFETLGNLMKSKHYDWANWFIIRIMKKKQYLAYAIFAAKQVVDIYEKKYPDDKRPRLAIEAAEAYLKNPRKKNKDAAYAAAYADKEKMQINILGYGIKLLRSK